MKAAPYPLLDESMQWLYICPSCNRKGVLWEFQAWDGMECPRCGNTEEITQRPNIKDDQPIKQSQPEPERDIHKVIKEKPKPKLKKEAKQEKEEKQQSQVQIGLFG